MKDYFGYLSITKIKKFKLYVRQQTQQTNMG